MIAWRHSAGCTSSARTGTRAGAWTFSSAGAAGRQGDPGESRFFVSLEDDCSCGYGIRDLITARLLGESRLPIENPVVRREVARAQRLTEGQNAEIRRTLDTVCSRRRRATRQVIERRAGDLNRCRSA